MDEKLKLEIEAAKKELALESTIEVPASHQIVPEPDTQQGKSRESMRLITKLAIWSSVAIFTPIVLLAASFKLLYGNPGGIAIAFAAPVIGMGLAILSVPYLYVLYRYEQSSESSRDGKIAAFLAMSVISLLAIWFLGQTVFYPGISSN